MLSIFECNWLSDLSLIIFQDDLVVKKLQQSFHVRLMETFSLELCPTEETLDPQQQRPDGDLRQTRKKLREFLDLWGPPGPKRTKTDQMETWYPVIRSELNQNQDPSCQRMNRRSSSSLQGAIAAGKKVFKPPSENLQKPQIRVT
ncbi:Hypothetical protein SMAX5B_021728 [Scophthalmus maximus]|uniref:Uncharacterized protein n=1 Tax=Scophthalmus maximus TaxID=52904 RepID=A0A2U9CGZ0_SCOMX|nr:Hypothetical protein SMAX5B_021728 [Scophthalmus maximus]